MKRVLGLTLCLALLSGCAPSTVEENAVAPRRVRLNRRSSLCALNAGNKLPALAGFSASVENIPQKRGSCPAFLSSYFGNVSIPLQFDEDSP